MRQSDTRLLLAMKDDNATLPVRNGSECLIYVTVNVYSIATIYVLCFNRNSVLGRIGGSFTHLLEIVK